MSESDIHLNYPPELPICEYRQQILDGLKRNQVIIVCGDTGSGKTTQLPKMALELGLAKDRRMIACTQPRRLAAVTVAGRFAAETGCNVGELVGYQHRYDKRTSAGTRVKFMTDGVLLAETRHDPLLNAYDCIIIDEAHERTLNIDFLLGIISRILPHRRNLKLIVASATLDTASFAAFFHAPVISVPGRMFPIEMRYRPPEESDGSNLPREISMAIRSLPPESDTLVFLPGERDIRETADYLGRSLFHRQDEIIPLLASLPAKEQQRAFTSSAKRRIILATNVAETSITIPGIKAVVDSGLARISRYIHRTQIQRLQIERISQASARQRAGRCGRTGPGICIRLYSEEDFKTRDQYTPPEILRSSLAGVILTMLDLRLGDIESFPFINPPRGPMVREGLRELLELGAVAHSEPNSLGIRKLALTATGRQLARIPIEPRLAKIMLTASRYATLPSIIPIVGAMSCDSPLRCPIDEKERAAEAHSQFRVPQSDFLGTLKLWRWWEEKQRLLSQTQLRKLAEKTYLSFPKMREWCELTRQLASLAKRMKLDVENNNGGADAIHISLLSGLLSRIGHLDPETKEYRGAHSLRFSIHPSSKKSGGGEWIVAGELVDTARLFARNVAIINSEWIEKIAGDLCKRSWRNPEWDARNGFVRAHEQVTLYGLVVVKDRLRDFSRIDPATSRELFIVHGLINGEFPSPPKDVSVNTAIIKELRKRSEQLRASELFDEKRLFAHFDSTIPPEIVSAGALRKWLHSASPREKSLFRLNRGEWITGSPSADGNYPDSITVGSTKIKLSYRFTPENPELDGITATVRKSEASAFTVWHSDWLVPGALPGKIKFMIAALPAALKRALPNASDTVTIIMPLLKNYKGCLEEALRLSIKERFGIKIPLDTFDKMNLPAHLRMRFTVKDDSSGEIIVASRELTTVLNACGITEKTPIMELPKRRQTKEEAELEHQFQMLLWEAEALPQDIYDNIETQIAWLVFPDWHNLVPAEQIKEYPRYIRAIKLRIDRAKVNPISDRSKESRFEPFWNQYEEAVTSGRKLASGAALDEYRWMLEEYRISLFAQEIGTRYSISPKRLEIKWLEATEG